MLQVVTNDSRCLQYKIPQPACPPTRPQAPLRPHPGLPLLAPPAQSLQLHAFAESPPLPVECPSAPSENAYSGSTTKFKLHLSQQPCFRAGRTLLCDSLTFTGDKVDLALPEQRSHVSTFLVVSLLLCKGSDRGQAFQIFDQ